MTIMARTNMFAPTFRIPNLYMCSQLKRFLSVHRIRMLRATHTDVGCSVLRIGVRQPHEPCVDWIIPTYRCLGFSSVA